jgi:hypothetical protein
MDSEPVGIITAAVIVVLNAGVVLARAFGWWDVGNDQLAALVAFITAVSGLGGALARARVYSPATVRTMTGGVI